MLAGIAQADIFVPFGAPEFAGKQDKAISGNVGLGYDAKYVSRGLALAESDTDHVFPFQLTGQYSIDDKNAIVGGISYTRFLHNDTSLRSPKTLSDEGTGLIEFAHHFSKRTVLAAGYQFVHGGLPGSWHTPNPGDQHDFPMFDSHRAEEHSFVLDFHHEFGKGLEGFFYDGRVQAAFQWETGWWFYNTVGYKHEINEKADLIVSASWVSCANYFGATQSNGTQGYSLNLAAPVTVADHVRVTPHIGVNFIGNGANSAKTHGVYRDTTVTAGVSAAYVF